MKKILFFCYVIVLSCLTVFSYGFIDKNLFYLHSVYSGFVFVHPLVATIIYVVFVSILFACFLGFLLLTYNKKLSHREIKIMIILTLAILFFAYPAMLSYDIFNYVATAKVLFFYHENPYIVMPIEFIKEPLLAFMRAPNKVALYGPIWILLSGIPYGISFGNFIAMFFAFKLVVVAFYCGIVVLLWKMTRNLFSIVYFALNPLVIIESILGSHNDVVMMFLVLLSFYLLRRKKVLFAILFLIFSVFIKYTTLFLVPIFIYCLLRVLQKKEIDWDRVWLTSAIFMFVAFMLSPIREEAYPWYALWFLPFVSLVPLKKFIIQASFILSFSLLFRYIPYMYFQTYLPPTPMIREILSFAPPVLFVFYYVYKKKI